MRLRCTTGPVSQRNTTSAGCPSGLGQLRRVLEPGGELHMFEHVFPFSLMMKLMNPLASRFGPETGRDTVANVKAAAFRLTEVNHVFLDTVKTIHAVKQ